MSFKKLLLLLALIPAFAFGEQAGVISDFRGLHNSDASILINDNEAQSLSNVDFSPTGKSIMKRDGYALYQAVGVATHPVTGGYFFKDVDGDDTLIVANDGSVYKSQTSGTFSAFVTTDTSGAYYDFVDSQGAVWRANSEHDEIWKYDGATLTYYPSHPKGDQVEALPDRLVISGTVANPNRLNFSGAADFTTFTTGLLETDPFYEDVFLPGQKITAIKVACGGVITWSKETMAFYQGTNQYDGRIDQISDNLGTLQPSSVVVDLGVVYFQGQDGHFYSYDCNTVSKISSNLDASIFANGSSKLWTQTTQSDWGAGSFTYVTSSITVGDVQLSTWTATDEDSADFTAGTVSNTTVIGDRVYLSTNNTNVLNNSFESPGTMPVTSWSVVANSLGLASSGCHDGTYCVSSVTTDPDIQIDIRDTSNNSLGTQTYQAGTSWEQKTFDASAYAGRWIKLQINSERAAGGYNSLRTTDAFLCSGGLISIYVKSDGAVTYYDLVEGGRSTTYSGTFTSQSFDTNLGAAAWLASNASWTANSHSISVQTQSSPDGSTWDSAVSWSTGSAPTSDWDEYIRYVVTISTGGTTNGTALPYIEDVTLSARASSGTFISQTKNIGANATSFGNFTRDQTLNSGTIGYFIRTATTEGGLGAASWVALTADAKISASINPWIQLKSTFTITDATYDPTMSAFTVNWNEGALTRHWGIADKDHRLMWSIAENADTYPSVSYLYDQRFGSWLKYSFPFYAPARSGNTIYWGSPSAGNVYQYPSGTSDNGSAITAFWKSKDFVGSSPFVEKNFNTWGMLANAEAGSNIDMTYTVDTISTTVEAQTLTDPNSVTIRRRNENFPSGTFGTFINFKFGNDDIDAPFELFGFVFDFDLRPWRVME